MLSYICNFVISMLKIIRYLLYLIFGKTLTIDHIEPYDHSIVKKLDAANECIGINSSNVIITLTTIPRRLISDEFITVLNSLFVQKLRAKYVVLNMCVHYNKDYGVSNDVITNRLKYLSIKFPDLIINLTPDYGPATKLIGLLHLDRKRYETNDDDIVIVVDDDCPLRDNMTQHYALCYSLYTCDCIFINERDILIWSPVHRYGMNIQPLNNIYYNNYQNFAYGWLSFSIKMINVNQRLKTFYDELVTQDNNMIYHDDLIFTLYYKTHNLYACGMNIMFNIITPNIRIIMNTGLHTEPMAASIRHDLERKFADIWGIELTTKFGHNYIVPSLCINTKQMKNESITLTYFNDNTLIVTVEQSDRFDSQNLSRIVSRLIAARLDRNITVLCSPMRYSTKHSFFIKI